jgi:hypothetical protein
MLKQMPLVDPDSLKRMGFLFRKLFKKIKPPLYEKTRMGNIGKVFCHEDRTEMDHTGMVVEVSHSYQHVVLRSYVCPQCGRKVDIMPFSEKPCRLFTPST